MKSGFYKNTLCISLLSHITLFVLFSFSFGSRVRPIDYSSVNFWGQVLGSKQVNIPASFTSHINPLKASLPVQVSLLKLNKLTREDFWSKDIYVKPHSSLFIEKEKRILTQAVNTELRMPSRPGAAILLHPLLPYRFTLYFKDRQVAHVELMFNVAYRNNQDSVLIKRKISSGSLELDLLIMRYIKYYLFIQRGKFTQNKWQTVKIDLSAKND